MGKLLYKGDNDYFMAHDEWIETEIRRNLDERIYPATGLSIQEMHVGPAPTTNPDPRFPPNAQILQEAFRNAGIEVNGGGSAFYRDKDELYLLVGHRPLVIGYEEPMLSRIGRWIERLGQ